MPEELVAINPECVAIVLMFQFCLGDESSSNTVGQEVSGELLLGQWVHVYNVTKKGRTSDWSSVSEEC